MRPSRGDKGSSCIHSPVRLCKAIFSFRLLSACVLGTGAPLTGSWPVIFQDRWESLGTGASVCSFVAAVVTVLQKSFLGVSVVCLSHGVFTAVVEGAGDVVLCSGQFLQRGWKVSPLTGCLGPQQWLCVCLSVVSVTAAMVVGGCAWSVGVWLGAAACGCECVVRCFLVLSFFSLLVSFDANVLLLLECKTLLCVGRVELWALDVLWCLLHPFPLCLLWLEVSPVDGSLEPHLCLCFGDSLPCPIPVLSAPCCPVLFEASVELKGTAFLKTAYRALLADLHL